jgi:hypothetical protein
VETRITNIEKLDGKARLFIIKRDDGLFSFLSETETEEDGYTFWQPYTSGFYETPEAAEADARNEISWLKILE